MYKKKRKKGLVFSDLIFLRFYIQKENIGSQNLFCVFFFCYFFSRNKKTTYILQRRVYNLLLYFSLRSVHIRQLDRIRNCNVDLCARTLLCLSVHPEFQYYSLNALLCQTEIDKRQMRLYIEIYCILNSATVIYSKVKLKAK